MGRRERTGGRFLAVQAAHFVGNDAPWGLLTLSHCVWSSSHTQLPDPSAVSSS